MARETDQKSYEHELGTAGKKQMVVVPPSADFEFRQAGTLRHVE